MLSTKSKSANSSSSNEVTLPQVVNLAILLSVILTILGILALTLPLATGIAIAILMLWVIFFAGVAHVVHAFDSQNTGIRILRVLTGSIYIICSIYLVLHPALSLASFTLLLAVVFLVEALFELFVYFQLRGQPGAGWALTNAIGTLILAILIGMNWPSSSAWAIGILVGVNLVISGVTFLVFAFLTRQLTRST
ncbi:MAG: HdeD family acid-resistance protein [Gammaproteobacteria bacterium]